MKQIFDSSFNLISFYTKIEFDSKFKYFLRKESKAKIVITNRISLFNKDDLLNFEIVNKIQNDQSYHNINGQGIRTQLMYVMDKIMIYNNNLIKIIKSRYDSDNELIDIKKYNNYIRKEKIKNIIKIES